MIINKKYIRIPAGIGDGKRQFVLKKTTIDI